MLLYTTAETGVGLYMHANSHAHIVQESLCTLTHTLTHTHTHTHTHTPIHCIMVVSAHAHILKRAPSVQSSRNDSEVCWEVLLIGEVLAPRCNLLRLSLLYLHSTPLLPQPAYFSFFITLFSITILPSNGFMFLIVCLLMSLPLVSH